VKCPGRVQRAEGGQGGWVGPAVQEVLASHHIRVRLYATLVQEWEEDRGEGEQGLLQERVSSDKEGRGGGSYCVLGQVECGQGCGVGEVGQLGQVPAGVPRGVEIYQPLVAAGP